MSEFGLALGSDYFSGLCSELLHCSELGSFLYWGLSILVSVTVSDLGLRLALRSVLWFRVHVYITFRVGFMFRVCVLARFPFQVRVWFWGKV